MKKNPTEILAEARAEGAKQWHREAAEVRRAAEAHGLSAEDALELHSELGCEGAIGALEQFGQFASASVASVYEARARVMAKDAPRLAGVTAGSASATAQAGASGAEPMIDAAAIYARRAVQASGG